MLTLEGNRFARGAWLPVVLLTTLLACLHMALTHWLRPPFRNPLDTCIHVLILFGRFAVMFSIPFYFMPRLLRRLYRRPGRAVQFVLACALPLVTLLFVADAFRGPLTIALNNDVSRFYAITGTSPGRELPDLGEPEFQAAWTSGRIKRAEVATLLIPLIVVAIAGCLHQVRTRGFAFGLALLLFALVQGLALKTGLYVIDYDFFYGSTLLGPALLDLLFPITVSFDAAFSMTLCCIVVLTIEGLNKVWSRNADHALRTAIPQAEDHKNCLINDPTLQSRIQQEPLGCPPMKS